MSLEIRNLKCGYKDPGVLTLDVGKLPNSGLIAILGANGAGKTTVLKTLCGLIPPLSGELRLAERPLWISTELDWDLQLSPADIFDLYQIDLSPRFYQIAATLRISMLFDRKLQELSSGEKRRIALIVSLCHRSPIIIIDEPTNFLEYRARVDFAHLLCRISTTKLVIFSTHEIEWLAQLPSAACWILDGKNGIHILSNSDGLVENSQLVPIFGGVFRAIPRSTAPSQKILYFQPESQPPDRETT